MKKSKLLIPLLTIGGLTATVAPLMTSCSQSEKEEKHFTLTDGKKDIITAESIGSIVYTFTASKAFTKDEASLVQFTAICNTVPAGMSLVRCYTKDVSSDYKTFKVQIDYSIDPAYITSKPIKLIYDIKAHNGTWFQLVDGFTITAEK